MTEHPILIIGAGLAGLTCARALAQEGLPVRVLDKGRGPGGRMSTRRAPGVQFDHGAPGLQARTSPFAAFLDDLVAQGVAAAWSPGDGPSEIVGTPGMSAIPGHLAKGLEVVQEAEVSAIRPVQSGVEVHLDGEVLRAGRVVSTVPAPQLAALLPEGDPMAAAARSVHMSACLTLMAVLDGPVDAPDRSVDADPAAGLSLILRDGGKPGRTGDAQCWVAHAGPDWTARHLEQSKQAQADAMAPMLAARLGIDRARIVSAHGHRWRFARAETGLGTAMLAAPQGRVFAGGDWCLGPTAEDAWTSGRALAEAVLSSQ